MKLNLKVGALVAALILMAGLLAGPAFAKNFAVPAKDPAATISIPDSWKTEEIEYGISAYSPGKDVFFSVESADEKTVDAMMKTNAEWLKENKIDMTVPVQKVEKSFNGLKGTVYHRVTKDEDGPTNVDFVVIPLSKNRVLFLTLWASDDEYKKHQAEFDGMIASLKPIS